MTGIGVAEFIRERKGDKYSALLPLLGLHHMEIAAENLRQLAKSIEGQANLNEKKYSLKLLKTRRQNAFGAADDDQVFRKIVELHVKYCPDKTGTTSPVSRCDALQVGFGSCAVGSVFQKRDYRHEGVKFGCVGGCDLAPAEIRRGLEPGMLNAVLKEETGYGCRWIEGGRWIVFDRPPGCMGIGID